MNFEPFETFYLLAVELPIAESLSGVLLADTTAVNPYSSQGGGWRRMIAIEAGLGFFIGIQ